MEDLSYLRTEYARNKMIEDYQKTAEMNKRKIVAAETAEGKIKHGLEEHVVNPQEAAAVTNRGHDEKIDKVC